MGLCCVYLLTERSLCELAWLCGGVCAYRSVYG